jgi:hypothetical protein
MLVIAVETVPDGHVRWAGRRHDDDRPDASSGASPSELFDAVFHALHDGEQVALGFDCALTMPVPPDQDPATAAATAPVTAPAELAYLLGELGNWRPWTTVSTSLARWKANTSILVWQAVPAPGANSVTASAAADSFFRELSAATRAAEPAEPAEKAEPAEEAEPAGPAEKAEPAEEAEGTVVNLAAAAARRAGLFVDPSELAQPTVSIIVTGG